MMNKDVVTIAVSSVVCDSCCKPSISGFKVGILSFCHDCYCIYLEILDAK